MQKFELFSKILHSKLFHCMNPAIKYRVKKLLHKKQIKTTTKNPYFSSRLFFYPAIHSTNDEKLVEKQMQHRHKVKQNIFRKYDSVTSVSKNEILPEDVTERIHMYLEKSKQFSKSWKGSIVILYSTGYLYLKYRLCRQVH